MLFDIIKRFFRQSLLSFKALFGELDFKVYVFVQIIDPILQLIFFCLLAKYVYKADNITPWVIGNSLLLCTKNTIFGIGFVLWGERIFGTLKLLVAAPANKFLVFVGRSFMHIIDAMIKVIIGLVTGYLLFGVSFAGVNLPILGLNILIAVFAASGFGLLICSMGLRIRDMNLIMNTAATLLLALSGANFPVEKLPNILQKISYILPLTRSIEIANSIMHGVFTSNLYRLMLQELFIGVIYLSIGYLMLQYMENKARKAASLDIF